MSAADEFPLPPGDAGRLTSAGQRLTRIAADLGRMDTRIRAERAGMAGAWSGDAGEAAGTETTSLATITGDKGTRVRDGATALTNYGTALETAVGEVTTIRRQADEAERDARSEAVRTTRNLPHEDREGVYLHLRTAALTPLRQRYRSVMETLDRAAAAAAGALTDAVPEYRSGMSPADVRLSVRDSVALRLPSVLQRDGQNRGRDLAGRMDQYLRTGKQIPPELLAELEANQHNPWFAKTLLETLGPQAPDWAMRVMTSNGFPKDYNQRVITGFGRLMALGTRTEGPAGLSDSYVDAVLGPLDHHDMSTMPYAWNLAHLLHFGGTFGTDFLSKAGDKLYALDRAGHDSQMYTMVGGYLQRPLTGGFVPSDTMQVYFTAVAKDAEAAQRFFHGHADRLEFYLAQRGTDSYDGDQGEALGSALEAATARLHDDGPTGRASAEVTADLVRVLGRQDHDFLVEHDREKVLPHAAAILNSWDRDVFYALSRTDYGGAAESVARLGQPELGTKDWGVNFAAADLRGVLGQIDHDTEAYKSVVKAQVSASEVFLQDKLAAAREDPARRDQLLQSYARSHGMVLRELFDTHLGTQVAMGRLEDFDRINGVRWGDTISGSIMGIIPAIPHPAFLIGGLALGVGRNLLMPGYWEDATRPGQTHADRATAASSKQLDAWYAGNLAAMITTMQDGGGFAGTPAEAGGWQQSHGIPADARFTDGQGRILDPASMSEAQKAAYGRWMSDPENEGVRLEMVRMFTALDAAGSGGPR